MSAHENDRCAKATQTFLNALAEVCGEASITQDPAQLHFASLDLFFEGCAPLAQVSPSSVQHLVDTVKLCRSHKVTIFAKGGGMSYSRAFQPTSDRAITLEFSRLDTIRAIALEDGHIIVEAGCTWAQIDEALKPYDRRTRFWGPMSGLSATIGGSMSQGTVTFGSGTTGASANAVKSFEIVTGTGEILLTGSDGSVNVGPENRNFGPDLTGIFANDAGALGIKAAITLEIEPRPKHVSGLSFAYDSFSAMARLLGELAERRLASEIIAMDGDVARQNSGQPDLLKDAKAMWKVGQAAGTPMAGLGRMGRIAFSGRRFIKRAKYTAHFVVEGRDRQELASRIRAIRSLAKTGSEIVNTVPLTIRAMPFSALPVTHPDGRRMLPIHGIFPMSTIGKFHDEYISLKQKFAARMEPAGVTVAEFFAGIAGIGILYEPVFYWPDQLTDYHRRLTPDYLDSRMVEHPDNPPARALVTEFTETFVALVNQNGGTHFQIGRLYPYAINRKPAGGGLLRAIKNYLDPDGIINPGALGL